jgi:predicted transcriptional regulator
MTPLSWRKLQAVLNQLTEAEVLAMLEEERRTLKRASILERLHMKYSVLRTNRERIEIMKEAIAP